MLAQCYIAHHSIFPQTPRKLLKRKRRQRSVIENISTFAKPYTPTLLCLQELDCYEDYYYGELRKLGYGMAYKQRTARKTWKHDGSVVAFKTDRFELIQVNHLEFNDLADIASLMYEDDYLVRESIASVCVLRDKKTDKLMVVVSAHLYWNPKCVDIKILQATILLRHVNDVAKKHSPNVGAVILCGDLNSVPSSAVFSILTTGKLDHNHADCQNLSKSVFDYIDATLHACTSVPCLFSAYHADANNTDVNNTVSTMTDKWHGHIDYIMYRNLETIPNSSVSSDEDEDENLLATLSLPTVKHCSDAKIHAFPSYECPSDHLPVAAVLNFFDNE